MVSIKKMNFGGKLPFGFLAVNAGKVCLILFALPVYTFIKLSPLLYWYQNVIGAHYILPTWS